MKFEWRVSPSEQGIALLDFLQERFKDKPYSKRKIKGWVDAGYCQVQGRIERFSRSRLRAGSVVSVCVTTQTKVPISTLYEDDVLLVINKPAKITCDERLEKTLKALLVHRLDKDTTGVLLLAKTAQIRDLLMKQFEERAVHKEYLAIVEGTMAPSGTIDKALGPISRIAGQVKWGVMPAGGHHAKTDWVAKKNFKKSTLVQLIPHTGRTHQLRVHLASIGHSIIGDKVYGKPNQKILRQLLHAEKLTFLHPVTSAPIQIVAPLPQDMVEFMNSPCAQMAKPK
jgi:23S rRNA pseudouridine1911/1915/1917 synthase